MMQAGEQLFGGRREFIQRGRRRQRPVRGIANPARQLGARRCPLPPGVEQAIVNIGYRRLRAQRITRRCATADQCRARQLSL